MKKVLNILLGIVAYVIGTFLFMGYGHKETHVPLNKAIGERFLELVKTNDLNDKQKFKYYEFNWDGSNSPNLPGMAYDGESYLLKPSEVEQKWWPMKWIAEAGWMEDEPWGPASICHFYDPLGIDHGKTYITDNSGLIEYKASDLKELLTRDAKSWATGSENSYGWIVAKANLAKAFRDPLPSQKVADMALAYRCLGQSLHLVSDMGCPPHVRNDSHPPNFYFTILKVMGDPDPYEDICKTLDVSVLAKATVPNGTLKNKFSILTKYADIFEAMALFTNTRFFSGQTIVTDVSVPPVRPFNPYPSPVMTQNDYDYSEFTYYATYEGNVTVKMCKDKVVLKSLWGQSKDSTRGFPYLDAECVESMASAIVPNVVEAGANVIRLFVPSLKMDISVAKVDSGGIVRGKVAYALPNVEEEYKGLLTLDDLYNGPVSLFINGTDTKITATAVKNNFEFKLAGKISNLKKDDVATVKLDVGGIVLKSADVKLIDSKIGSNTVTLGTATLKLLPAATSTGNTIVQHFNNKMNVIRTSGTVTHTAEISWLTPPTGNLDISEGKILMNQTLTIKLTKSSTGGNAFFDGCEIWVNGVSSTTGWYNDWQQSNEAALGFSSANVQKILPGTTATNTVTSTIDIPVKMSLNDSGGPESGIDGKIEFSGAIRNFWTTGDNIQFFITYTYND